MREHPRINGADYPYQLTIQRFAAVVEQATRGRLFVLRGKRHLALSLGGRWRITAWHAVDAIVRACADQAIAVMKDENAKTGRIIYADEMAGSGTWQSNVSSYLLNRLPTMPFAEARRRSGQHVREQDSLNDDLSHDEVTTFVTEG